MKSPLLLILLALFTTTGFSQGESEAAKINWLSLEEAQKLNQQEPRKVLIDLYTDWCGWCKRMDASTFTHPEIVEYVNKYFYAVKLNAETKDTVMFKGQAFVNRTPAAKRSTNEIAGIGAREDGRLGYPTIVYLDEELNRLSVIPGFQTAKNIEPVLNYFGGDHYKTTPWEDYMAGFEGRIVEDKP